MSAGRTCPLHYRYQPEIFRSKATLHAETLYVIGGLYGNPDALETILNMKAEEERRGQTVTLLFNGDFNWFNRDAESFEQINRSVLQHFALQGNVEAELSQSLEKVSPTEINKTEINKTETNSTETNIIETNSTGPVPQSSASNPDAGCGCNYPSYVSQGVVDRSNTIAQELEKQARAFPDIVEGLKALPRTMTVEIGTQRIGVLHGDPESMAGWKFSVEAMEPPDRDLRTSLGWSKDEENTTESQVWDYFQRANVTAFACTHTCLPFAQDFRPSVDFSQHESANQLRDFPNPKQFEDRRIVINNGSAGMANFQGTTFGLLTRISVHPKRPEASLYGTSLANLRFDALPIHFDMTRWTNRFLNNWPEGSPAHTSYFGRIQNGPNFWVEQARRWQPVPA